MATAPPVAGTRDDASERGTTLVELIVFSLLLTLIVAAAGAILINSLRAQRDVTTVTQTSSSSQVATKLFERTVRNAATVSIPSSQGGNLLVVKTRVASSSGSQWVCRAFHYDTVADEIRVLSVPATGTPATVGLASAVNSSSWPVVLSGVIPTSGSPIFGVESTNGARMRFQVSTGQGSDRLSYAAAAVPRPQGTTIGGASCS